MLLEKKREPKSTEVDEHEVLSKERAVNFYADTSEDIGAIIPFQRRNPRAKYLGKYGRGYSAVPQADTP